MRLPFLLFLQDRLFLYLDTSIIIPWLKENYDYDVIAVCGDVGQGKETDGLEERAKKAVASKLYIEDLRDDDVYR